MLTQEQKAVAKPLLDTFSNMCLMQGTYKGKEAAFVCAHSTEGGSHLLVPRLIVVTDDMLPDCRDSRDVSPGDLGDDA